MPRKPRVPPSEAVKAETMEAMAAPAGNPSELVRAVAETPAAHGPIAETLSRRSETGRRYTPGDVEAGLHELAEELEDAAFFNMEAGHPR